MKKHTLIAVALVLGGALRLLADESKPDTSRGETHYYLTAAGGLVEQLGHLEQKQRPYATWVEAREWQAYLHPSDRWAFAEIGHGHARYDVHPPLTSWILNLWSRVFGVSLHAGRALMTLLSLATIWFLYALVAEAVDEETAGWTALLYALSPVAIQTQAEVRHYTVVAAAVTLFTWAVHYCSDPEVRLTARRGVLLALATAFGALTFHLFTILAVVGAGAYTVVRLRADRQRLAGLTISVLAGYGLAVALYPDWYLNFTYARGLRVEHNFSAFLSRCTRIVVTLIDFFVPENAWRAVTDAIFPGSIPGPIKYGLPMILAVCLGVWLVALLRRWKRALAGGTGYTLLEKHPGTVFLIWMYLCTGVGHYALFLAFLLQESAMGGKYLSLSWPFLALLPALLLRRSRPVLAGLAASMVLCTGFGLWHRYVVDQKSVRVAEQLFVRADRFVIGTVFRENLYEVLWYARPEAMVYAATQADLLARRDEWLPQVEAEKTVFVGYGSETNSANVIAHYDPNLDPTFQDEELRALRAALEPRFVLEPSDGGRDDLHHIFLVHTGTIAAK